MRDPDPRLGNPGERQRTEYLKAEPVAHAGQYCPNCGEKLQESRCKLTCTCGFFLSCSDFY